MKLIISYDPSYIDNLSEAYANITCPNIIHAGNEVSKFMYSSKEPQWKDVK